jgi:PRC-barrel domain
MPDAAVGRRPEASFAGSAATEECAGYTVCDPVGQRIGIAEEVFVSSDGDPVYIKVRISRFWRRTVLVPVQFVESDEERRVLVLK